MHCVFYFKKWYINDWLFTRRELHQTKSEWNLKKKVLKFKMILKDFWVWIHFLLWCDVTTVAGLSDAHAQCSVGSAERLCIGSWQRGKLFYGVYCNKENKVKMVYHSVALPLICFTTLWGLVGGVAPFFVPKGPNRGWITPLA